MADVADDVSRTVSVTCRIGRPYLPPTLSAINHQSCVTSVRPAMRASAVMPARTETLRSHQIAYGIHSTAPKITNNIELPLSDPAVVATSANTAAHRHGSPRRLLRAAMISHGSALNGSNSADCPVMWPSTNGDSPYARPPTTAARRSPHNVRKRKYAPAAARNMIVPIQNRCATQSGMPSRSVTQEYGPIGQR